MVSTTVQLLFSNYFSMLQVFDCCGDSYDGILCCDEAGCSDTYYYGDVEIVVADDGGVLLDDIELVCPWWGAYDDKVLHGKDNSFFYLFWGGHQHFLFLSHQVVFCLGNCFLGWLLFWLIV